jgi:hypothetical protein
MIVEPVHEDYGMPMSEWIALVPNELSRDAVGMFQIVPAGRDGFHLDGTELVDFIRRAIHRLLDAGALPVRGGAGTDYEWIFQHKYGTDKSSMTEAIIKEWLAMPDDPLVLCGDGVWFARPKLGTKYLKVD